MSVSTPVTRRRRSAGFAQSLVEFALVTPIFLALLIGVVDSGRLAYEYNKLNHAVQEGGRVAALPGTVNVAAVQSAVTSKAAPMSVSGITVAVNEGGTAYTSRKTGDKVAVSANHAFVPIVSSVFGTGSISLSAKTEISVE